MSELRFKVIEKCFQDASKYDNANVDFYLEESDWNDYGYCTSYHLHASKRITGSSNRHLGHIRIMRKGQGRIESYTLRQSLKNDTLEFSELPNDFISLSFALELFEELNRLLDSIKRKEFIRKMHLILSEDSEFYDSDLVFDQCFCQSLLRDASIDDYYLKRGRMLLEGVATLYDLRKQNLEVKFSHIAETVSLDFSCIDNVVHDLLPNGISVFIGKNGSGKSTAIYKLAKLLYSDPTERFRVKESVGILMQPNNIGVNKLFLISYSPFDNFTLPAITNSDYQLMFTKEKVEEQRFIYCGIRDINKEYNQHRQDNPQTDGQETYEEEDRINDTFLKSIEQLADEFASAMSVINSMRGDKYKVWESLCECSKTLQPALYNDIIQFRYRYDLDHETYANRFKKLSTGHKFMLHSIAHLVAYIEDDCLVLFDEPENHLHPPLLSFLMTQMKTILAKNKSVMLIATHSPVVVQEVFANNVYIVNRDDANTTIRKPRIETYGENIGAITSEVFGLTSDITNFYDTFDYLYEEWKMRNKPNTESMLKSFYEKIGFQLSGQIQSYLINLHNRGK